MSIGGEARESDEELVVNLGNALKIRGYSLELNAEPSVAGNGEAVLADHSHHGASVVLEDRHPFNLLLMQLLSVFFLRLGLSRQIVFCPSWYF